MDNKESFVLITGCNSDIGNAIANKLALKSNLILSGRNNEKLEILKSKLPNSHLHVIWKIDLKDDDVSEQLFQLLKEKDISIKAFIHVAGLFKLFPIRLTKKEDLLDIYKVNVLSAIQICTVLSKKAYKTKLKNILFISSISALRGKSGYSVYASAKAALSGLTKSLAIELKDYTSVNTLILGAINTEATKHIITPIEDELNKHIPLGLGDPLIITKWASFLIENDNVWVTGQEIIIDGGATAL